MPAGSAGSRATAITAPTTAIATVSRSRSRGHSRAMKAAHAAASRPVRARVPEGVADEGADQRGEVPQHEDREPGHPEPETRGPRSSCATATAVDSSIVR